MVVAPVLQIMPELQQLCVRPASPLFVDHMEVNSPATSCEGHDPPLSCEHLEAPESIVLVVTVNDDVELDELGRVDVEHLEVIESIVSVVTVNFELDELARADVYVLHVPTLFSRASQPLLIVR